MKASVAAGMLTFFLMAAIAAWGKEGRAVVVYDDVATEINPALEESSQLWIPKADLVRATRFEVKPQGVCRDEICIPLPKARMQEFVRKSSGREWFNLTAFAQLTHQAVAHDAAASVWYFGLRSDQQQTLASLQAPDFTLPDINGKPHSLSDFRGKKVLLVTWASW
ncbi:MAG: redoxin domain-containing protein [Acidobacteriia bacterium]|nr:redoxin domain-containing protein [Terriglobia bacterium]